MATDIMALGRAVKRVQWRHHRGLDRRLAALGTTITQWDALRAISEVPGASAHDLAQRTFMSDQAFGTLANRLGAQDLIARVPGVGRRIEHRLTPAGEGLLADASVIARQFVTVQFADLSESERETLLALLLRLV
ncbi:MarR family transcriptional regulator [Cryobacterium sp. GrIS_2_6]|uniref:MarR family winged helix-turn-helix transcriptional regulator n=1 Tax=Cryobacterium sp. GrIS_2_6 TaxID=3162785 RepID=UPI002DFFE24A|nr:MarR family transcriptional regulator [Cryobacterium psychrotolerans]MEC5149855.1 DNA-binding MarR family transcriptional regulator [Cryobacterium psychrotolerans]